MHDNSTTPALIPGDPGKRKGFCGGTDAAALICAHEGVPYFAEAGEWSVWASQHSPDLMPVPADREARFAMGHHLESIILDRYHSEVAVPNGLRVEHAGGYIHAPEPCPWLRSQIDGLLYDAKGRIVGVVDGKATERPWEYREWTHEDGEWGQREVYPRGYEVQLTMQLALLRLAGHPAEVGVLAVLDRTKAQWKPDGEGVAVDLDSAPLIVRDVLFNNVLADYIIGYVTDWWERYVVRGEEPANDSSKVCTRWRTHEQNRGLGERPATDEEEAIAYDIVRHKADAKHHAEEARRLGNELMASMDLPKLTMGRPYVQIQNAARGAKSLRSYRFPTTTHG